MNNEKDWFTEQQNGAAFSLRLKRKLHEETTAFQRIEIFSTESFGNLMVIDGCIMLTARDNFIYHEMMTHPALVTHPAPETVWIIGGGDCGSLKEVLKHPQVKKVVQIEIDERVTRLAEEYFPELCNANSDPRAEFHFTDGIQWTKDAPDESVDVIIVDSTDPVGPAEGLFQKGFYSQCKRCLGGSGILIQQSESPLFHADLIRSIRAATRSVGFAAAKTLFFPQCCYPSGWWSATMAGKSHALAAPELIEINFETRYYNPEIHRAALAKPEFILS